MTISPIWGHLIGVATVVTLVIFIGIWIWAWRKKHKPTFSRMAALPMEDDPLDVDSTTDNVDDNTDGDTRA